MESSEKEVIEKRKRELFNFLKEKKEWIYYAVLSAIIFVGLYVRTRNILRLKDVTTNDWTLAPDLDPFLFLRWAKDIVENGSLMAHDIMRYSPLGYNTAGEMKLLSYMIAWFYDIFHFFNNEVSVTYAAIWFPVIMFFFTIIAFFLFARKVFYREKKETRNIIALIATAFFVLVPSLLPRTIAGVPEKESAAFLFMFLAFYFYLEAFTSEKTKRGLIFGLLAGISTGLMALVWGGFIFVFLAIPVATFFAFILGKIKIRELMIYSSWLFSSLALMMPFSTRYTLDNIIASTSTGSAISVFAIIGMSLIFMRMDKVEEFRKKTPITKELFSAIFSIILLGIIAVIMLGPDFIFGQISEIKNSLISPQTSRFGLTVAENKQPYFVNDWKFNLGPVFKNIPLFFWLFFAGAVLMFNNLIEKMNKKEKIFLTSSYLIFLVCLIFSKYASGTNLNGTNGLSITIYFFGWLFFLGTFGYYYYERHKKNEHGIFKEFNFSYILYFITLTLAIIGARAGIRLIMVLGAVSPVAISFLIVKTTQKYLNEKEDIARFIFGALAVVILISSMFTLWAYYQSDLATGSSYAPGGYQIQWQNTMSWVRENTDKSAVFAHWWDYGYWIQSIGERATILDGGNAIGYWNHLMGRLVLTGTPTEERQMLEFLFAHNGTHLLIDSTEIGKYTAFSSIGSDVNYDRISGIPTLLMDNQQTQKTNNETVYVYPAGIGLDEDIVLKEDGKEILLPRKMAAIGAIILKIDKAGLNQPDVIFIYNNNQYSKKLRYAYFNNQLYDFGSGIDAGIFIFPSVETASGQSSLNNLGAMLYLSPRVVHSNLARIYLFGEESNDFKLVHTESNLFVNNLKQQGYNGEFVYFQGFQGPIKIWEIKYPSDIQVNEEYLSIDYPSEELDIAKPGEY